MVLLERSGLTAHGNDHLDLATFPEQLRRLREVGAVTPDTDVVAVHLSHRNPPEPELSRRLADWGARVVDDGTTLGERAAREGPRRSLVIGGARSGKSREAERILARPPRSATWPRPTRRSTTTSGRSGSGCTATGGPSHWETVETLDLVSLLRDDDDGGALLVDCLTLWLTRVMDRHDAWDDAAWASTAEKAVLVEVDALVDAWATTRRRVVAVTNEVGQGVVPATAAGRRFRDAMGALNARLAAATEDVRWCAAGRVVTL